MNTRIQGATLVAEAGRLKSVRRAQSNSMGSDDGAKAADKAGKMKPSGMPDMDAKEKGGSGLPVGYPLASRVHPL